MSYDVDSIRAYHDEHATHPHTEGPTMTTTDLPAAHTDTVIVGRKDPAGPVLLLGYATPDLTPAEWVEFYQGKRARYADVKPMTPGYTDVRVATRVVTYHPVDGES